MSSFCKNFYLIIISVGNSLQSILLLAMRIYWGGSLILSGLGKLYNISASSEYFFSLNIPFPTINAYLVGSIECVGGFCLFIGLASRLASIPVICILIGALLTEHREALINALNDPQNLIIQLPFNYLLTAFIVLAFGPGKISIDFLIKKFFIKNEISLDKKQ
jgi:putative oxidoreductase